MHTKLAELFTRPVIEISVIQQVADTQLLNALSSAHTGADDTTLAWLNLVDAVQSCAKKHDATLLVTDSLIEDYLQGVAYNVTMEYPEDVRESIDTDALVASLTDSIYMKLLEYPEPIGGVTEASWGFF